MFFFQVQTENGRLLHARLRMNVKPIIIIVIILVKNVSTNQKAMLVVVAKDMNIMMGKTESKIVQINYRLFNR